jgi:predicted nucleic acid-binding protein
MISAQAYRELLQDAEHKRQQRGIKELLHGGGFQILPFTASISQRAMSYIEEYTLSGGGRTGDAIIAAPVAESNRVLATGNGKQYKSFRNLELKIFRPQSHVAVPLPRRRLFL